MAFPGEAIELGLSGYDELGEPTAVVFRLTDNSVTTLGMGPPVRMEVSIGLEIEAGGRREGVLCTVSLFPLS